MRRTILIRYSVLLCFLVALCLLLYMSCKKTSIERAIDSVTSFKEDADYRSMNAMAMAPGSERQRILADAAGTKNLSYFIMTNPLSAQEYDFFPSENSSSATSDLIKVVELCRTRIGSNKSPVSVSDVTDIRLNQAGNRLTGSFSFKVRDVFGGRCLFQGELEGGTIVIRKLYIASKNSDKFEDGLLVLDCQ